MNDHEAIQHALGYAAGREDASGVKTAEPGTRPGFVAFADAYAAGWKRYNSERLHFMISARGAYDAWQASAGQSIYKLADQSAYVLVSLADEPDTADAAVAELAKRGDTVESARDWLAKSSLNYR